MQTIKQNLYILNLSISNKKQKQVIKPLLILFLLFISICPISFSQDFSNQLNDDSLVLKPDYRNHINIPVYDPSLMPLNRQTSSTGIWTELNPKVPRVDYIGVFFINKDTGWACGANGTLIKTTIGGEGWSVSETNTTLPILKVKSFNGQIVIASGYDGLILRSIDSGESFTQITSGVTGDLWGLEIVNDTLGWICSTTTLLKTTDAGASWQIVNTPGYTGNLWAIEFLTDNYGFIAADGKILRTTNGGVDWQIIQAGDNQSLYIVDIIDSLHIAAAGYGGTSYRGKNIYSSDGGLTWITGGPLTFEPVNDIRYVNRDTGYVVMNNTIGFKTTNRGQQWTGIAIGGDWEMQFFKEQNIGYSVGTGLRIYKTENSFENWQRIIINDNFSDVFFINEETGFAISEAAFQGLYKTINGGINWNGIPGPSGKDIFFLDSLTGFIGSSSGLFKTTDGGINWYLTDSTSDITKIFFINLTTGWAVSGWSPTEGAIILKTTDCGETWFVQATQGGADSFTSIFFVDSLNGWATSRYVWQTTDGGVFWTQRTDIPIYFSTDIYFPNLNTGWIARYSSVNPSLFKSTNGGLNWEPVNDVSGVLKIHLFPDPIHWLVNAVYFSIPKVYLTGDSGNTWLDISDDVPSGFNNFNSVTDNLGFAIGKMGLILRYEDTTYVPVELVSFEGKIENKKIVLYWVTASELNNQGFYIEKSYDKINWETIEFINGKGTTTETNYYSFVDIEPGNEEINYRLKQVDFNGSYTYSRIITVYFENTLLTFELFQNFPNPFNPKTTIKYTIPKTEVVNIYLYSILGDKITELINEEKQPGVYTITLNSNKLSSGIYFYKIITGSGYTAVKKLTIIK